MYVFYAFFPFAGYYVVVVFVDSGMIERDLIESQKLTFDFPFTVN